MYDSKMDNLITNPALCRITLTDEHRELLRSELERTGISLKQLEKRKLIPRTVTQKMISAWINGHTSTVQLDHLQETLHALKALPNADNPAPRRPNLSEYVRLTEEQRRTLEDLLERTGANISDIIGEHTDPPPNLSANIVLSWLKGKTKNTLPQHYEFIVEQLSKLPEKEAPLPRERIGQINVLENGKWTTKDIPQIELTRETRGIMRKLQEQSGLNPRQLLESCDDVPDGLTSAEIYRWLSKGESIWVCPEDLDYVLKAWSKAAKTAV